MVLGPPCRPPPSYNTMISFHVSRLALFQSCEHQCGMMCPNVYIAGWILDRQRTLEIPRSVSDSQNAGHSPPPPPTHTHTHAPYIIGAAFSHKGCVVYTWDITDRAHSSFKVSQSGGQFCQPAELFSVEREQWPRGAGACQPRPIYILVYVCVVEAVNFDLCYVVRDARVIRAVPDERSCNVSSEHGP